MIEIAERSLELRQRDQSARLFAPLFIDLAPRRLSHELTWRQLTVAQDRKIEPRDVAVGYRVQIGNPQWLIYRSLADQASRSLLGQNLSSNFRCSRPSRRAIGGKLMCGLTTSMVPIPILGIHSDLSSTSRDYGWGTRILDHCALGNLHCAALLD